jgi:response regulator RpfG family c-di-GMP phosphodiesterase
MNKYIENRKILYIDDEEELLKSFKSLLRKENYQISTLSDSSRIESVLNEEGPFALVLSDQRMPTYDGVKVLESCKIKSPDSIRILVTGYSDYKDTIRAVNIGGIHSHISKPWNDDEIKRKIHEWIEQFNLKAENNFLMQVLDLENEKLNELLDGTVTQTVKVLGDITSHIAPQAALFAEKVKILGNSFLENAAEISSEERWEIKLALNLFNLGVTLLPATVHIELNKRGLTSLDDSSFTKNHHLLAAGLLKNIPRFEPVARIIELQSKDFNGKGEPKAELIKGEQLPLGARLLHILLDLVKYGNDTEKLNEYLSSMRKNSQKYDVELISKIQLILSEKTIVPGEVFLPLEKLKPGMLVVDDIKTINSQHLLLKSGSILTETFINILNQWHIREPIQEPIKIRENN